MAEEKVIKKKQPGYIKALGRRKEAVASVRLHKGKGEVTVNETPIEKYFPSSAEKVLWQKPFQITKSQGEYYATVRVKGSGKSSQLDAVVHGLARALSTVDTDFRTTLKKAHLLTRDPRVKERRKFGNAQKARKGKQSPKR